METKNILAVGQSDVMNVLLKASHELLSNQKKALVEEIKVVITEMVGFAAGKPKIKNSDYISSKLGRDYTYLANLFSKSTGSTIEHFIIAHKIEQVKKLLLYTSINIAQISFNLNYSSVAHLSNQFKKITGSTLTAFKNDKLNKLAPS